MKVTVISGLLWTSFLKEALPIPRYLNAEDPCSSDAWKSQTKDTESHATADLPFRVSVNQHWIVHARVTIHAKAHGSWAVMATQLLSYETTDAPLHVKESLLLPPSTEFDQLQNSSVYLALPRVGNFNGFHDQPDSNPSTWMIELTRFNHDEEEDAQNQNSVIMRKLVTFPQRVPADRCIHTQDKNCIVEYRDSPMATIYFNATSSEYSFRKKIVSPKDEDLSHKYTWISAILLVLITVLLLLQASIIDKTRITLSCTYSFARFINRVMVRNGHGTPATSIFRIDSDSERYGSHQVRADGQSSYDSSHMAHGASPTMHEMLWLSAYQYSDSEDDEDDSKKAQSLILNEVQTALNSPPFILRKFSSTIWSFSTLFDGMKTSKKSQSTRIQPACQGQTDKQSALVHEKRERPCLADKSRDTAFSLDNASHGKLSLLHSKEYENSCFRSISKSITRLDESGDIKRILADKSMNNPSLLGVEEHSSESMVLNGGSQENRREMRHDQLQEALPSSQVQEDNSDGEIEPPCYHTSCNLSEISQSDRSGCSVKTWHYYGTSTSSYYPITSAPLCVKEVSKSTENLHITQEHHANDHGPTQKAKSVVHPAPAPHYSPSEDIQNRSRSLLVPVWEFIPSTSSLNGAKEITNTDPYPSSMKSGVHGTQTNWKGKRRLVSSTWKRNVKHQPDQSQIRK